MSSPRCSPQSSPGVSKARPAARIPLHLLDSDRDSAGGGSPPASLSGRSPHHRRSRYRRQDSVADAEGSSPRLVRQAESVLSGATPPLQLHRGQL